MRRRSGAPCSGGALVVRVATWAVERAQEGALYRRKQAVRRAR